MKPEDLDVRHAFANVRGLRMHFVEKGNGPLVLLLHGFPEMWWSWRYQISALAEAGYRVVAPDLRGYNETEARGPYDLDTLRDDVIGLLDHLGVSKTIIVGHDWGGGVAWHLASTRQERCAKLVVMNCPHPAVFRQSLWARRRQFLRSWYMFFFLLPVLPEWILTHAGGAGAVRAIRALAVDKTHFGTRELAPFADAVCKTGRASAMLGWYRTAIRAGLRGGPHGAGPLNDYEILTIPTLLVWGMYDRALGYEDVVPGTERWVPGIEIQPIVGCGHFVHEEEPDEVNGRLIAFLARPAADGASRKTSRRV